METILSHVILSVVYAAIQVTEGAKILRWYTTRPDYAGDTLFVTAHVWVPNEFASSELKGNYDRLLKLRASAR